MIANVKHVLNERLCKQLIAKYFRDTQRGGKRPAVVLHELLHSTYAHGFAAGAAPAHPGEEERK